MTFLHLKSCLNLSHSTACKVSFEFKHGAFHALSLFPRRPKSRINILMSCCFSALHTNSGTTACHQIWENMLHANNSAARILRTGKTVLSETKLANVVSGTKTT